MVSTLTSKTVHTWCHSCQTPRYTLIKHRLRQTPSYTHVKHHAHMAAMRPGVVKAVQQAHAVLAILWIALADLRKQQDLIAGRLGVVLGTLLDLQYVCVWCLYV